MKTLNHKKILYISFMILFILYLITINSIVFTFSNNFSVFSEEKTASLNSNKPVFYAIDHFRFEPTGVKQNIFIDGWAFVETSNSNENKEIRIALKNKDNLYSFPSINPLIERKDLHFAFENISEKNLLQGNNHGFDFVFSTTQLKNGTYDLIIECIENEESFGYTYTGYTLVKNRNGLSFTDETKLVNIKNIRNEQNVFSDLTTTIDSNNEEIEIEGIAYLTTVPSSTLMQQEIFLEIEKENQSNIYRTIPYSNYDLKTLSNSCFRITLPRNYFDSNDSINLIIRFNNKAYRTPLQLSL